MSIAIVILNWNGKDLLKQFLPSVIAHSPEATIYVADNASTDDSVAMLQKDFPSVSIIKNDINGGYAKGYNDALKDLKEPILCLLNNDVEVTSGWLDPVEKEFEIHDATDIIQPKILDFNKRDHFEYAGAAGGYIDKLGYPYCRGRIFDTLEKDVGQYNNASPILWASGACLFIRRRCFEKLQGFDESFFAHMEEIDLCWRAHNRGSVIKCIPDSVVFHVGGATLNKTNSKKVYLNFRNSLYTLVKNAPKPIFILVFKRMLLDGVAAAKYIADFKLSFALAILKAHLHFYQTLPRLLRTRKKLQKKNDYFKTKSIVFSYYAKGVKTFDCL